MTRDSLFVEVNLMGFYRIVSIGVVLLCLTDSSYALDSRSRLPKIQEIAGRVVDLSTQPTRNLIKSDRILEKFHARLMDPSSRIVIDLYDDLELEANSEAEVLLPNISWETRQISDIQILKGWVQLEARTQERNQLKIKSPLFEISVPKGNLVLYFDPDDAKAGILVFHGEVVFGGLNADETVLVRAGEKVEFQGVKEEGEISFDLLLKGRKVPKGTLGKVQKISDEENKKYSPVHKNKRKQEKARVAKLKIKMNQENLSGTICRNPAAPLNYCKWSLKTPSQCVRERCTADGLWKDVQVVSLQKCEKKPFVKNCDY